MNGLGLAYTCRSELDNARVCLVESLAIARELAAQDAVNHDCDVSDNLNNLANLDTLSDSAKAQLEEALQICRKWADQYPDIYKIRLARTLMNYGRLEEFAREINASYNGRSEAIRIYRELAHADLNAYGAELAQALSDEAEQDEDDFHRPSLARDEIEEAVKILRQLVQNNPEAYRPYLASNLPSLSGLDHAEGRDAAAQREINEAVQIYRILVRSEPDAFSEGLSNGLDRMAGITEDDREAAQDYAEALRILRTLVGKNSIYKPDLAEVIVNVAIFDRNQGRVGRARQEYAEAERIFRGLEQEHPGPYRRKIAVTLMDEGYLEHDRGRMNTARTKYSEALRIIRELVTEHQDVRELLANTLYGQALLDRDVHKASNALVEATESVSIFEDLARADQKRFASGLDTVKKLRDGLVQHASSSASP